MLGAYRLLGNGCGNFTGRYQFEDPTLGRRKIVEHRQRVGWHTGGATAGAMNNAAAARWPGRVARRHA